MKQLGEAVMWLLANARHDMRWGCFSDGGKCRCGLDDHIHAIGAPEPPDDREVIRGYTERTGVGELRDLFVALEDVLTYFPTVMEGTPQERGIRPREAVPASVIRQGRRALHDHADAYERANAVGDPEPPDDRDHGDAEGAA